MYVYKTNLYFRVKKYQKSFWQGKKGHRIRENSCIFEMVLLGYRALGSTAVEADLGFIWTSMGKEPGLVITKNSKPGLIWGCMFEGDIPGFH